MDIRTKLVFTLVAVALASMAGLALLAYQTIVDQASAARIAQLEGLAEFKARSLESILEGWEDRLSLVSTRERLRTTLADYNASPDPAEVERLELLLGNVRRAAPTFHEISVHGPLGERIASAGVPPGHAPADLEVSDHVEEGRPWFLGTVFPETGEMPLASLAAPLDLDGERVGYLHALLSLDEIVQMSRNYEGLGETGETMVIAMADDGPRVLHPVRAAAASGDSTPGDERFREAGLPVTAGGPAAMSLQDAELHFEGDLIDYRGQEVWAATDYLPEPEWGVLVKIDATEQDEPVLDIRDRLIYLVIVIAAFAIAAGTFIGYRVAQPIHLLSEAANRIREGDLSARTGIEREDEVGLLAQTFDKMAAELEEQVELLTEYRHFFDMSLDMMCIADTDGYFKRLNTAWTRELGWSREELLSRPFVSFVHPDDVDKTIAEVGRLAEGMPTIRFENRYLCKDGSYKVLAWRSTPQPGTGRVYAMARVKDGGSLDAEPDPTEARP